MSLHGGDRYGKKEMLDFSENVNPLGLPKSVKKALCASAEEFAYYPDPYCRDLKTALAQTEQIPEEWICFGNGAADLIYRAAFALKPEKALLLAPTFSEYEQALNNIGCQCSFHFLKEAEQFRLTDGILEKIQPDLDWLVICSPNNPTGWTAGHVLLIRIAQKCLDCGVTLLLDECFLPFVDQPEKETLKNELEIFPNVLLLGAFTKIYGMAGLRLGWLFCSSKKTLTRLEQYAPPWNVSAPAQIAGITALQDREYLTCSLELVQTERQRLSIALQGFGATLYGSQADYLFFKWEQCPDLDHLLEAQGILIRSCRNYRGLGNSFYRIGIKTPEKNQCLLETLQKIVNGI